jgi:predicted signal transduction protein with EAL and GGDEF domain
MAETKRHPIRVLVVDDDPDILVAYRQVLDESVPSNDRVAIDALRARLFSGGKTAAAATTSASSFEAVVCNGAEAAVAAVRQACDAGKPLAVAFLDMRMPPGPDGAWAAEQIRALDPDIEIVICTAFSDVDPAEIGRRVPPAGKLFYLQKPFHPHEVRQLALALGEKRQSAERRATLTEFDALTGLPSRTRFIAHLKEAVAAARANNHQLAVLHFDLDNFRRINDALGLVAGDELLRLVAQQLRESVRRDDVVTRAPQDGATQDDLTQDVARIGGDQFMVLLHAITDAKDAAVVAERLTRPLVASAPLANRSLTVTASVGIAIFPTDSDDDDALLRHAGIAMNGSRRQGPGRFAFFDEAMHAGAQTRLKLESLLQTALEKNEFSLHYQPQFDLSTGRISGMEALLRWNSAELGPMGPDQFIPVAEEIGVILPVGEWVLRTACRQARIWQQNGLPDMRIAVNVSCLQFTQPNFATLVAGILAETGLEPRTLELEITESLLMKNEAWTTELLVKLRGLGVSVAIDDFGIGYSSLGRLNDFPVNRLKIDRSFVQGVDNAGRHATLVAAILSMAKALGLDVVAEGVEDFNQLLHLQDQHCNEVQGYLLSRPLPVQQATELLERLARSDAGSRTMRLRTLAG